MSTMTRWTSADLKSLPDDGNRYEIIDGELHMSTQPHWYHQFTCKRMTTKLDLWNEQTQLGEVNYTPGLIFAEDDDVVPDVVWISNERLGNALEADGKLHASPELVIEVLSPGSANERRDREAKLQLYGRRGAEEYWIVNWMLRCIDVYRCDQTQLHYIATLFEGDSLESALLPGFSCTVAELFERIPREAGEHHTSPRMESYRRFYQALVDELREQHHFTSQKRGLARNTQRFGSGVSGRYGVSFAKAGRIRVELYIDEGDLQTNEATFTALLTQQGAIQREFDEPLEWEPLEGRRAFRIAVYREGSIDDAEENLVEIRAWALDRLLKFKSVFDPRL